MRYEKQEACHPEHSASETVAFIGRYSCYPFGKGRKLMAELCFLDFLSLFAYNKLELLWITIATYR